MLGLQKEWTEIWKFVWLIYVKPIPSEFTEKTANYTKVAHSFTPENWVWIKHHEQKH